MQCVVGIDLGSTTTKAVLMDRWGALLGQGITNSRSNYEVACAVAHEEAVLSARRGLVEGQIEALEGPGADEARALRVRLMDAVRLELYLDGLAELVAAVDRHLSHPALRAHRDPLAAGAHQVLDGMERSASDLFLGGAPRRSDFFRDLAGAAFMAGAEQVSADGRVPFDRLVGLFDRAILDVEVRFRRPAFSRLVLRALDRVSPADGNVERAEARARIAAILREAADLPLDEVAFVGTGYGRQTLPFPKEAIRSEILCHGRGAHDVFPDTRTVLDIGGQDTKAIQVDEHGVVTSFQMNDRCAAGCGRYLGYIADELNLGLHELGPLALQARRRVRVNSTCTVFAGAELRDRLSLGQNRSDILAGLHRAMMLRAMSLLARSGGITSAFSFTGGVCKNPMATRILDELVKENYGDAVTIHTHADSIYMGARGAALFALADLDAGHPGILPNFGRAGARPEEDPPCGASEPATRAFGSDTVRESA
jgi:benzoyl-CoA reductase subunit A